MSDRILRALVTGASSGLGAGFARQLADQGVELVLVARREGRLRDLASDLPVASEVVVADLADPAACAVVEDRLADEQRPVDLLVNAAGFGAYGAVADLDVDHQTAMIDVNVTALTRLTRAVLPQLVARWTGGVINIGSTAGFQPGPHGAVYGATKAYVRSFTEALHEELRTSPVEALLVAPGVTATEFQAVAEIPDGAVPPALTLEASQVVAETLTAFAAGRTVCVPGTVNKLNAIGSQVTPSAITRRLSSAVHRRFVS